MNTGSRLYPHLFILPCKSDQSCYFAVSSSLFFFLVLSIMQTVFLLVWCVRGPTQKQAFGSFWVKMVFFCWRLAKTAWVLLSALLLSPLPMVNIISFDSNLNSTHVPHSAIVCHRRIAS